MRIYAVADIHGRKDRLAAIRRNMSEFEADVLVIAGDIAGFNPLPVLESLNGMPSEVLIVRGNSDPARLDYLLKSYRNISSLHLKTRVINGIRFAGVSGAVPLLFCSRLGFGEQRIIKKLDSLVSSRTVLLAHPPPWGTLDKAFGRFHVGCHRLHEFVLNREPALLICGHIHEQRGTAVIGKTIVVNCSMGQGGAGAMIEVADNQKIKIIFL